MEKGDLEELGRRIETLTMSSESIRAPFTRLFRPFLLRIGWRPKTSIDEVQALVECFKIKEGAGDETSPARQRTVAQLRKAAIELKENIRSVERATVITRRPLVAYARWLRRLYELVVVAEQAIDAEVMLEHARSVGAVNEEVLAPPIVLAKARGADLEARREKFPPPDQDEQVHPDPTRLLDLQLDTLDHILEAAREEGTLLARRRLLLEAARQLLLETSAALAVDSEAVHLRLKSISRQITSINRMEALDLRTTVSLVHQARTAYSRGEREKLFAAIQAIDRSALARGDLEISSKTRQALDLMTVSGPVDVETYADSIERSGVEMLGRDVAGAVRQGYQVARKMVEIKDGSRDTLPIVYEMFRDFVAPGAYRATLSAALSVDGCFDLGGAMTPTRVEEDFIKLTAVPFPTQDLQFVPATGPEDLPNAVITDPRLTLLDLAAGRLLTRQFVREETERRSRIVRQGEVRVYVLDGSTSMFGPRARMRDAILVAELATLVKRLTHQRRSARVVLFYRYFNDQLGPVERVDSPHGAIKSIQQVVSTPRRGATNIEKALIASIDQVREARERDPDLSRAHIVLITDGDADVSEKKIVKARAGVGDMPVGVSVVALGEENKALRTIVAHQRVRGERAFYHFMPDDYIEELVSGRIDDAPLIHLPAVVKEDVTLDERLGALVEDLADLERTRDAESIRQLYESYREERQSKEADAEAEAEVEKIVEGEGSRACLEALHRDEQALAHRYLRWFPEPRSDRHGTQPPEEGTLEQDDLESVVILLHTIAEVVEIVDDAPLARQADAIDLFERLIPNARLTPSRYQAMLNSYPDQTASALGAVHAAVRWGVWRRMESPQRPA